ncbi:MAG: hypothetical protein PHN26_02800 [Eubacteriaceae bacterium]|nr:hypothetical protein [Eubacteriaceae bacterium]
MKTKSKVLFSVLIALAMMCFAMPAFAAETTGAALHITSQPVSATAYVGQKATFNVEATGGTGQYSYQWYSAPSNDTSAQWEKVDNVSATTDQLEIVAGVRYYTGAYFHCVVTDTGGATATSNKDVGAFLTILKAPTVTVAGPTEAVKAGESANLTATVTADSDNPGTYKPDYTYQWKVDKNDGKGYAVIDGATSADYTVTDTTIAMNGYKYNCFVSDNNATSGEYSAETPYTLTVKDDVSIKTQPSDATVWEGVAATFTVEAQGGDGTYTYQWMVDKNDGKNFTNIDGATGATYTTEAAANAMNGYRYRCVVTSEKKTVTSASATLTVKPELSVAVDPNITAVKKGESVTLTAKATGGQESYHYAWYKDGVQIEGAVDNSYKVTVEETAPYKCIVTDARGKTAEATAVILATEGSITDGIISGSVNEPIDDVEFTITLPEGLKFAQNINDEDINKMLIFLPNGLKVSNVKQSEDGNQLTVKVSGTPTQSLVGSMGVFVPKSAIENGTDNVIITENPEARFEITEPARAGMVSVTNSPVPYDGQGHAAKVEALEKYKAGLGTISNIRYKTGLNYTSDLPVNAGAYSVAVDISDGTQYTAATDLKLGSNFVLRKADQKDFEAAPGTYFSWTASKGYTGKALSADVDFAKGITKAGTLTTEYKRVTTAADGTVTEGAATTTPTEIGTYNLYVTTTGGDNAEAVTAAKIGTFEITKVQPTKDDYTMSPTEAAYTGSPIAVTVTPKDASKAGNVTATYYYDAQGKILEGAPTVAGVYTVKVDTAETDTRAAMQKLEIGTLTIKAPETPLLAYCAHVENIAWMNTITTKQDTFAGTTGRALRMEALNIQAPEGSGIGIEAQAHVQNNGWMATQSGTSVQVGTTGQALRMEAIKLKLTGENAADYSIRYKVHIQNYGWTGWIYDGDVAGTTGQCLRMEAIQIQIIPKTAVK